MQSFAWLRAAASKGFFHVAFLDAVEPRVPFTSPVSILTTCVHPHLGQYSRGDGGT